MAESFEWKAQKFQNPEAFREKESCIFDRNFI